MYLNCRGFEGKNILVDKLVEKIQHDSSGNFELDAKNKKKSLLINDLETTSQMSQEKKFFLLLEFLAQTEENFLFFLDNVDHLLNSGHESITFVENLLEKCPSAKIIITCRDATRELSNEEMAIKIEGMGECKQEAWKLFEEFYGKKIPPGEMKSLAGTKPDP